MRETISKYLFTVFILVWDKYRQLRRRWRWWREDRREKR